MGSEVGRFISKDPIGLRGGLNPYVYVNNNPINFIDPMGLVDCPDVLSDEYLVKLFDLLIIKKKKDDFIGGPPQTPSTEGMPGIPEIPGVGSGSTKINQLVINLSTRQNSGDVNGAMGMPGGYLVIDVNQLIDGQNLVLIISDGEFVGDVLLEMTKGVITTIEATIDGIILLLQGDSNTETTTEPTGEKRDTTDETIPGTSSGIESGTQTDSTGGTGGKTGPTPPEMVYIGPTRLDTGGEVGGGGSNTDTMTEESTGSDTIAGTTITEIGETTSGTLGGGAQGNNLPGYDIPLPGPDLIGAKPPPLLGPDVIGAKPPPLLGPDVIGAKPPPLLGPDVIGPKTPSITGPDVIGPVNDNINIPEHDPSELIEKKGTETLDTGAGGGGGIGTTTGSGTVIKGVKSFVVK